jgi:hypothetical protein
MSILCCATSIRHVFLIGLLDLKIKCGPIVFISALIKSLNMLINVRLCLLCFPATSYFLPTHYIEQLIDPPPHLHSQVSFSINIFLLFNFCSTFFAVLPLKLSFTAQSSIFTHQVFTVSAHA